MNVHFTQSSDTAMVVFVLAIVCLGLPVALLWERRHTGPALYTLGRPRLAWSVPWVLGIAAVTLIPVCVSLLLLHLPSDSLASTLGLTLSLLGLAQTPLFQMLSTWRITERGLSYPLGTLKWEWVRSWRWIDVPDRPGVHALEIRLSRLTRLSWAIPMGREESVDRILRSHLDAIPTGVP